MQTSTYETIVYSDYENMIIGASHIFLKKYPRQELDILISEGNVAFCRALDGYDNTKSKFSTWLRNTLNMHLNDFCRKAINKPNRQLVLTTSQKPLNTRISNSITPSISYDPERQAILSLSLSSLSEDVKTMIECVLNVPTTLINMLKTERNGRIRITRYALRRYFHDERGWSDNRCRQTFNEIRECLKSIDESFSSLALFH